MPKIEECENSKSEKSNGSSTTATNNSISKKFVRFGSQITESFQHDSELENAKSITSTTAINKATKANRASQGSLKYLVCFSSKSASNRNKSSESNMTHKINHRQQTLPTAAPNNQDNQINEANHNVTTSRPSENKSESYDNLQPNHIKPLEEQRIADSFRNSVQRIFRQFSVKNKCCCRLVVFWLFSYRFL